MIPLSWEKSPFWFGASYYLNKRGGQLPVSLLLPTKLIQVRILVHDDTPAADKLIKTVVVDHVLARNIFPPDLDAESAAVSTS